MNESGSSGPSGAAGDPKRRLFSSKRSVSPSLGDPRLEAAIQASHRAIAERFEESLQGVAENALSAIRQIAEEAWQATGTEVKDLKERILRDLSREQAIRGLVAHSDERFQALDVRVARIEEGMGRIDEAAHSIRGALGQGGLTELNHFAGRVREWLESVAEAQTRLARDLTERVDSALGSGSPGLDTVRDRLAAMQEYLGSVVQYLAERDRTLIDWLQTVARNQAGEMRTEANRILSILEQRLDARTDQTGLTVRDAIALHAQSVQDRIDHQATLLADGLAALEAKTLTRIQEQSQQISTLADQVRGASEDVNRLTMGQVTTGDITHELDERLGRLIELVSSAIGWTVDQMEDRIRREVLRSVEVGMADLVAMLDRRFVDLDRSIGDRVEKLDRAMRTGLGALEASLGERSVEAIEGALAAQLSPAATAVTDAALGIRESAKALELIRETMEAGIARALDDRVAALARLIRSDNKALADRLEVVERQAAAKEAIRAVNELAAAIPGEIGEALDQRLAMLAELFRRESRSTADVVAKVGGALADRMDRSLAKIGDRFDQEVETVVDHLGDTMATLATGLQRTSSGRSRAS
jgi:hypothetical protein